MGVMKNEAEKEAGVYHDRIGLLRTPMGFRVGRRPRRCCAAA